MTPRNNQLSIEAIIAAARPIQRNDIFGKAAKIAQLLGEQIIDKDEFGFLHSFIYDKDGLTICYFLWGDLDDSGFGVAIEQENEQVYGAGTQKISLHKPGPWEQRLDRLYTNHVNRN